ncbi:YfbU family protein [Undibacterium sp. Di26W]|uniref:YfbU family protein n=1 Tax=Undibacterium sp. Di26W TaxID=3413035 RepID=UPI003BF13B8B
MAKLSKNERLILINQYKILASLNKDEEDHYLELIEVLERGYAIFYSLIDEWVSDDMPIEDCKFVLDILDLYRTIEDLKRSTKDEQLSQHTYSFFRGFDGNNETDHMSFCRFLIENQGKFQEQTPYLLKNDNLNSHVPMSDKYLRMLEAAKEIPNIWNMTTEQALRILNA